ncbi:unnamed protein product (macronuclear) [Paramecium tetraurelia]|uniref:Transcription factor CBF/NF-Y/archaeal histone domain-containing protein n=1 Tax=Paramecium tetraurelia TaxID=5888 RepID=A0CV47_PARTE|nr:uncharacterized protein GSPATT00010832001 [Paramecium tetraurelia]CAK74664.1 unnamed protein product [Paramecium tetraurelia]|eukprot:XP_001442061.1 hypothetical protein (macronuclear) [Paramecium tetraurelia strain d4-2]
MKKQILQSGEKVITIDDTINSKQPTPVQPVVQQLSAYQIFMKDKKEEGRFSLQVLSQMWRDLPQDYKEQQYILNIQEILRKGQTIERVGLTKLIAPSLKYVSSINKLSAFFPLSRLKTILKEDDQKPQFKPEAYQYMLKAIEEFGELLLNKVKDQIKQDQRKTIKEDDLITVIKENQELQFLNCLAIHHQKKKTSQTQNQQGKSKTLGALDKFLENNNGI